VKENRGRSRSLRFLTAVGATATRGMGLAEWWRMIAGCLGKK
jgi:hypothetical protein